MNDVRKVGVVEVVEVVEIVEVVCHVLLSPCPP